MDKLRLIIIIYTTVLSFSALYAPQPIQPVIMEYFGVEQSSAVLLTTVTMFPLSIAPIIYGYILESVSAKKILMLSLLVLSLSQFIFYFAGSFETLVVVRVAVGMALPAVLTGIMTYISTMTNRENVQKIMAVYISSTIIGGFSGRFFSGIISYYFDWRYVFLILGVSLLVSVVSINKLGDNKTEINKINLKSAYEVLSKRCFLATYILIFSMFFMFAAVLNFIPFRLKEINPSSTALLTGVMYTGYIMGIVTSLNSIKLIRLLKGETKGIYAGLTIFISSLVLFVSTNIYVMFVGMFVFCAGMFMTHTIASGFLNKLADKNKGVTNGLYVSFYYSGGTIGSVLPGIIYETYSWNIFLLFIGLVMLTAMIAGFMPMRKSC